MDIVTQYHMNNFKRLKSMATQATASNRQKKQKDSIANYFTMALLPNVWKEIDNVVDKLKHVRKRVSNIEFPLFDLGLEEMQNINVGQAKKKAITIS